MSRIHAVVNAAKEVATAAKAVHAGNKATGKLIKHAVKAVGTVASKHPAATARVAGGVIAASGVKDAAAYIKGTDRSAGNLVKGVAKLAIGTGLLIYNDKSWYEQLGKVDYAANKSRPMDPIYLDDITTDATNAGMGKMVDVFTEWGNYYDSNAFKTAAFKEMEAIRDSLRSNLPYGQDKLEHYIVDSIALTLAISQIQRQISFRKFAPSAFPNFYRLWNKKAASETGYGPQHLNVLSDYDDQHIADTIVVYDALIDSLSGVLRLPKNVGAMVGHYFGNVFRSDKDDSNPQYITMRLSSVPICAYDPSDNFTGYTILDISDLSPATIANLVADYQRRYAIVSADTIKAGIFTNVYFMHYSELKTITVYDDSLLQCLINGYTSNSAVTEDGYVRMDQLLPSNQIDEYTQFLFTGPLNESNETSSLFTRNFSILSMQVKFLSNQILEWDHTLDQDDNFDFSEDFAIVIQTDIDVDSIVNVGLQDNSIALDQTFTIEEALTSAQFRLNLGATPNSNITIGGQVFVTSNGGSQGVNMTNVYVDDNVTNYNTLDKNGYAILGKIASTTNYYIAQKFSVAKGPGLNPTYCHITFGKVMLIYMPHNNTSIDNKGGSTLPLVFVHPDQVGEGLELEEISVLSDTAVMDTTVTDLVISGTGGNPSYSIIKPVFIYNDNTINLAATMDFAVDTYVMTFNTNTLLSFRNASIVGAASASSSSIVEGFTGLVPFMADQLDFHLPMIVKHTTTLYVDGELINQASAGTDLIKENYIPYMYNVKDLVPTLYRMFSSLFLDI